MLGYSDFMVAGLILIGIIAIVIFTTLGDEGIFPDSSLRS